MLQQEDPPALLRVQVTVRHSRKTAANHRHHLQLASCARGCLTGALQSTHQVIIIFRIEATAPAAACWKWIGIRYDISESKGSGGTFTLIVARSLSADSHKGLDKRCYSLCAMGATTLTMTWFIQSLEMSNTGAPPPSPILFDGANHGALSHLSI